MQPGAWVAGGASRLGPRARVNCGLYGLLAYLTFVRVSLILVSVPPSGRGGGRASVLGGPRPVRERVILRERARAGLTPARSEGRRHGRPPRVDGSRPSECATRKPRGGWASTERRADSGGQRTIRSGPVRAESALPSRMALSGRIRGARIEEVATNPLSKYLNPICPRKGPRTGVGAWTRLRRKRSNREPGVICGEAVRPDHLPALYIYDKLLICRHRETIHSRQLMLEVIHSF
jgi:hypothetical protein